MGPPAWRALRHALIGSRARSSGVRMARRCRPGVRRRNTARAGAWTTNSSWGSTWASAIRSASASGWRRPRSTSSGSPCSTTGRRATSRPGRWHPWVPPGQELRDDRGRSAALALPRGRVASRDNADIRRRGICAPQRAYWAVGRRLWRHSSVAKGHQYPFAPGTSRSCVCVNGRGQRCRLTCMRNRDSSIRPVRCPWACSDLLAKLPSCRGQLAWSSKCMLNRSSS